MFVVVTPFIAFIFEDNQEILSMSTALLLDAGSVVKTLPAMQETQVQSLGWDDPLKKEMATHSSILPEKSYGQRGLAGYSPRGHKRLGHD